MKFWKIFGATMAACGCCMVVTIIIFMVLSTRFLSIFNLNIKEDSVEPQTVLCIDFAEDIIDAPLYSPVGAFDPSTLSLEQPLTMMHAMAALEQAAMDSNIKGICIKINGRGSVSAANIEELRRAIERFKLSGKFVVAYDDHYTQSEYYLASVADHVILHREGSLEWQGVGFTMTFFKSLLDKIDAKVEVFRPTSCVYKSGVEPFTLTSMSNKDREQMTDLANNMWDTIVDDVSKSRNLDAEILNSLASKLEISFAEDALNAKLVDEIGYEDDLYKYIESQGVVSNDLNTINMISLSRYSKIVNKNWQRLPFMEGSDKYQTPGGESLIAVVYASGEIVDGNMFVDGYVHGSTLAAQLRQLRLDDNTKAVVLRVNSPGGSALASDVIWREMTLLQQCKPLIVSMGEYAASGGYYISAPADFIFTNRLTLTGSIGVFAVMFNFEETLKKHLGITLDSVGSSPMANGINIFSPLSSRQREVVTAGVNKIYDTFTKHVAEGRNLNIESVHNIAKGRIWSGQEAVNNNLADGIGGITEAIAMAADMADISDRFTIYEMAPAPTPFEEFLNEVTAIFAHSWGLNPNIYGKDIRNILTEHLYLFSNHGMQCVMPIKARVNL